MSRENPLENNPERLDEPDDIRMAIWERDGDPMNVETQDEAQFAWSLMHSWEDDPPPSRDDPEVLAAEAEMVADELRDDGVDVNSWPDIEDAPPWYDGP